MHQSITEVKGAYDRLMSRVSNMKKAAERAAGATQTVLLTNGSIAGFAFANETYGQAPADDATGLKELSVLGAPADLMVGVGMIGLSMMGMFGKYDEMALSVGNGGLGAFTYRFSAEWARKRKNAAPAATTSGATRQMGGANQPRPQGAARQHAYAPAP